MIERPWEDPPTNPEPSAQSPAGQPGVAIPAAQPVQGSWPSDAQHLPPVPPPGPAVEWGGYPPPHTSVAASTPPPVLAAPAPPAAATRPAPAEPPSTSPPEARGAASDGLAARPRYRWGWRALVAFVAGGLLTGGGFVAALLAGDDDGTVVATDDRGRTVVVAGDGQDPAADVAQVLGPSVVQIETDIGLGSGIYFRESLVVTNHHVIDSANQIRVRLFDGRSLPAELVGSDPRTDVAVVRLDGPVDIPIAEVRTAAPDVGELAVAIGSPFQLQQTVTSGIVSAVNRPIFDGANWNAMLQTDAAINPGNSGGALANRSGEVIGINTSIQTDGNSQSNAGVGFAMPSATVMKVADRILAGETLEPGFLGVEGGRPPSGNQAGVELMTVTPGSAAEQAGLETGDVVISLDGAPVTSFEELAGLIQTAFPGEEVEIGVIRNGEPQELTVVLGSR